MPRLAAVVLLFALPAVAAPVPKALKVSDADRLQGRWQSVAFDTEDGPPHDTFWIEFVEDKMNQGSTLAPGYTTDRFKLDPTATPKRIDLERGPDEFAPGLYHLDGDTLTWCRTFGSTSPRPTELKGGDGRVCYVFKRVKK